MITGLLDGFYAFLKAFTKIKTYKLTVYLAATALICITTGATIMALCLHFYEIPAAFLIELYPFQTGADLVQKTSGYLGGFLLFGAGVFLYKYIVMVVCSPVLSLVSERIEIYITRKPAATFNPLRISRELIRGLVFSSRNLVLELAYTLPLLLLGLFFPPLLLVNLAIQAYYAGFGCLDYYLERHYGIKESMAIGGQMRPEMVGVGAGFLLAMTIPLAGWVLAPFLATIATTELGLASDYTQK
ncbi:MAG: EI24 domain-containing protein [Saprospiraceae bacterium]|nr:EI24 domain-containing protein [Saprospiraceae bacterium]